MDSVVHRTAEAITGFGDGREPSSSSRTFRAAVSERFVDVIVLAFPRTWSDLFHLPFAPVRHIEHHDVAAPDQPVADAVRILVV
jgi:hypothetical protein